MIILSIETSCDDTGVALVKKTQKGIEVLASTIASQEEVHKKWGGVYPTEAKREHEKNLFPSFRVVLEKAGFIKAGSTKEPENINKVLSRETSLRESLKDFFRHNKLKKIDTVAVTVGPGLEPCLFVGVNFAKALSSYLNIPIIPVNHIKAHIMYFLLDKKKMDFPVLALIISGGHTELVLVNSLSSFQLIGKTRDDAAGECLDKTARILGLGYPGGPLISKAGEMAEEECNKKLNIKLPRPMKYSNNFDFSFSGLKTAVLYDYRKRSQKEQTDIRYISCMAKEIECAIIDVLLHKLKKAIKKYNIKTVVFGGGVTANKRLRKEAENIKEDIADVKIIFPTISHATDNAEIIGIAACVEEKKTTVEEIYPNANLKIDDKYS